MTHLIGRALLAAVLLTAAWISAAESTRLDGVAGAWQELATLGRDVPPPALPSRLRAGCRRVAPGRRRGGGSGHRRHWVAHVDDLVRAAAIPIPR
jgi:hypothetical protein